MKRMLAAVLVWSALAAVADVAPLTNTRYSSTSDVRTNLLRTNGSDVLLFWTTATSARVTKLVDGADRAGAALMNVNTPHIDAAWTGDGFLFAGARWQYTPLLRYTIGTRRLDAQGQPIGAEIELLEGQRPRLAASPDVVIMLYTTNDGEFMVPLSHDGHLAGTSSLVDPWYLSGSAIAGNGNGFAVVTPHDDFLRVRLLDRSGHVVRQQDLLGATIGHHEVAVAAHGAQYLIVSASDTTIETTTIDENGTVGQSLLVEPDMPPASPRAVSAIWNGDGWSIAYDYQGATIAHLTRSADRVLARELAPLAARASLAAAGGKLEAAWWTHATSISTAALPLAGATPRVATFGAIDQTLLAATSSANGTLFAWREGASIRVGLRTFDGDWSERVLADSNRTTSAVLASDGRNFALALNTLDDTRIYLLDEQGRSKGAPVTYRAAPRDATSIAWGGTRYAIANGDELRSVTPNGVLSAPVTLEMTASGPRSIASNGDGYLVTAEQIECRFLLCYSEGLHAVRLDPALARLDPTDLILSSTYADSTGPVWNGAEYVIAWQGNDEASIAFVPATGAPVTRHLDLTLSVERPIAAMADGNVAIAGEDGVALVNRNGALVRLDAVNAGKASNDPIRLAAAPNGRAVYASSNTRLEPPYHGATRVMTAIIAADTPPPAAPHASLGLSDTRLSVTWTPAAGTVNGYRVETRVDDGNWIELERWFGPAELGASIVRPASATTFAVRVRAFNDGGAGAYSNIATSEPKRRRAVR